MPDDRGRRVEPISTLAIAAATLFATKMAEEAGSQAGTGLSAAAGRLVAWLRGKAQQDTETSAALTMVQAAPVDHARIDLLAQVLATRANADPAFADQLRELVGGAQQAGDVRLTIGGAHIHGNVAGGQVTQVAGNQYQGPPGHR
jgi:hypothetical protein